MENARWPRSEATSGIGFDTQHDFKGDTDFEGGTDGPTSQCKPKVVPCPATFRTLCDTAARHYTRQLEPMYDRLVTGVIHEC
jgi:hypothetical protein